jgi:hypothetical protein
VLQKKVAEQDQARRKSMQREKLRLKILQQCKQIREDRSEEKDKVEFEKFDSVPHRDYTNNPKGLQSIRADKRSKTLEKNSFGDPNANPIKLPNIKKNNFRLNNSINLMLTNVARKSSIGTGIKPANTWLKTPKKIMDNESTNPSIDGREPGKNLTGPGFRLKD